MFLHNLRLGAIEFLCNQESIWKMIKLLQ